jgi:hypothetical protein
LLRLVLSNDFFVVAELHEARGGVAAGSLRHFIPMFTMTRGDNAW